jgi:type I site-specific restriction endonuclease
MQQGIEYARLLDVPFVFATNGDGFIFRDATAAEGELLEKVLPWTNFHRQELWHKLCVWKGYTAAQLPVITRTTTTTAAAKRRVITSYRPSTKRLKPFPPGRTAFCW